MTTITLTNDFHNTSVNLRMKSSVPSIAQIKRAQKTLCGVNGCTCGNALGMRGKQSITIAGQEYAAGFGLIPRFKF